MGLLDDAIREHLDLKRRRGADPAEVERAEREALGPVRRGPEELVAEPPVDEAVPAYDRLGDDDAGWDQLAHDAAQPELDVDELYEDYEYPEPPAAAGRVDYPEPAAPAESLSPRDPAIPLEPQLPPEPRPPAAPPRVEADSTRSAPGALEFTGDHDALIEPEPDRAPLPHQAPPAALDGPPSPPRPVPRESLGETEEYDVERAMETESDAPAAAGEDVLEETPEFLQDTPDHDRLWFEQRPPKDFNFEG